MKLCQVVILLFFAMYISATKLRDTYQDQNSWSFQYPTTRYTKATFDKSSVLTIATMKMKNYPSEVSINYGRDEFQK